MTTNELILSRVAGLIEAETGLNVTIVGKSLKVKGEFIELTDNGILTTPFRLDYRVKRLIQDLNSNF